MKMSFALLAVLAALSTSCTQQVCEKTFACQKELSQDLDDDYVQVCVATREGQDKILRASAEPECDDLANATQALAACEAALSCADLAAGQSSPGQDGDKCKDLRTGFTDALAATNNGAACDGIADPPVAPSEGESESGGEGAGEGEGEGEGEGDGG